MKQSKFLLLRLLFAYFSIVVPIDWAENGAFFASFYDYTRLSILRAYLVLVWKCWSIHSNCSNNKLWSSILDVFWIFVVGY